ncbi:phosphotransferase [Actinopolymorpha pittospori]|uniref:Ser/Thr protein kinase RdoA (MazF antagonist) n=2 Tax=Actinopolymorpha pittospori TaxID=648752 RepID=A0A927N1E0_9ACTN|nr:phosphotransferase [Actinopolymorpha pittospori]MBE1609982.1 Ser/Thr protein kinase RdoA (MazF antagonist) [Actinopolymorpha pittospori]
MRGSRMRAWWADFDRPTAGQPGVRGLVEVVARGSTVTDLGGCLSLNLWLRPVDLVLRVHQPFVSHRRLLALQSLRHRLTDDGLVVAEPRAIGSRQLQRCGNGWAELETYIRHEDVAPTWESYVWMVRSMGRLHRALAAVDVPVPKPVISTYAPPGSLRRWMAATEEAVRHDSYARGVARSARGLLGPLTAQWIPAAALPNQLIHGDGKLSNIRPTATGAATYLDFGFTAVRPRIHDLAHSLAWMVLRPDDSGSAEAFPWEKVPDLLGEYEDAAHTTLTELERRALPAYIAAVPLYEPAIAGYARNPVKKLHDQALTRFLRIAAWVLANPSAVLVTR